MSNKQESNLKSETPTEQSPGHEFTPELKFPDDLKNITPDYNHFGTFNLPPGLTPKSEQPK